MSREKDKIYASEVVLDVGGEEPVSLARCTDLHHFGTLHGPERELIRKFAGLSRRECNTCIGLLFEMYKTRLAEEGLVWDRQSDELLFLSETIELCLAYPKATLLVRILDED